MRIMRNPSEKPARLKKEKHCDRCGKKIKGTYVAYDKYFPNEALCFPCVTRAWLQTQQR
jgi:hypothetical protein